MSLDNPCLKYFVLEKQNRGKRRRTYELEPSSRLSRQVSRDCLCKDGKLAEARESAARRHGHGRAPRRARGSTRDTACSRGSQGGSRGSTPGPNARTRALVHFRFPPAAEESDSATPVETARRPPHRARNAAQEPGSPRRGAGDATKPRVPGRPGCSEPPPRTPFNADPGRRRRETHPGPNGAHGADPGGRAAIPGLKCGSDAAPCAGQ